MTGARKSIGLAVVVAVAALLTACGGGASEPPQLPAAPEVTVPPPEFLATCPLPDVARIRIETQERHPIVDTENYIPASFQLQ